MNKVAGASLLALVTASLSGCNTLCDLGTEARPYGGTARCLDCMKHTIYDDDFIAIPNSRVFCLAGQACDLPLSVVADTIVLPLTVSYTVTHDFSYLGLPLDASEQRAGPGPRPAR